MDLPPDKAKLLRSYDLEKKWEIICDQDMVQAKDSPGHYLNKLKTYLDPKASRSSRVIRSQIDVYLFNLSHGFQSFLVVFKCSNNRSVCEKKLVIS